MNYIASSTKDTTQNSLHPLTRLLLVALLALLASVTSPGSAQAQTYTALHSFGNGTDGSDPSSISDALSGGFLGTTGSGGQYGLGTLYSLADVKGTWTEKVDYSFDGTDGRGVEGVADLYGTTYFGGPNNGGTVFKVGNPPTSVTTLYNFCSDAPNCSDGQGPIGAPVVYHTTVLYGTTSEGGADNKGTLYEVNASTGAETVVHSFAGGADGAVPWSNLTEAPTPLGSPIFYGTTSEGGSSNKGTVFEFNATTGAVTILHSFGGAPDGAGPENSGVVVDSSGNLYGFTNGGGAHGYGTVYEITPSGTETILYSFTGGEDGAGPSGTPLLSSGILYGAAEGSGVAPGGTIFQLNIATGALTVLHTFCLESGCPDGEVPDGNLMFEGPTVLYGVTAGGGAYAGGVVFQLTLP